MELSGKVVNINFFIKSLLNLHWPMKCPGDQKEVEIQCLSSTESVISSSASPVQIQYRIQWENSVWGVLVQCTKGHMAVVGQCQASREAVYKQCLISMSEIFK